jgi:hypothetical protein
MQDIVDAYPSATVLNAERVVFRLMGNLYRAVVAFDFRRQAAFIKFVGTHAEYDKIDALTVDLYSKREPSRRPLSEKSAQTNCADPGRGGTSRRAS